MYKVSKKDIILLKQKDELTFDKIWKAYSNSLVLFILSNYKCIGMEDAKDIAEQTLINGIYYKINEYDINKSTFTTWLFSIAKNLSYDFIRKNHSNYNGSFNNDTVYYVNENTKLLLEDIKLFLSDIEFECIIKHKYYGLTIYELSLEMNCSKSKIKQILHSAYKKLQEVINLFYE